MSHIRVSASYLFNISFEDNDGKVKFLLIESERRKGKYQPIGGCYKFYLSAKSYLQSLGCEFENTSNGVDSMLDLRLLIPEQNTDSFTKWFLSGEGRETGFDRELKEELIDNLPDYVKHIFANLQTRLIKKEKDFKPFFDNEKNIMSIKPMDIVKLELTKEQIGCLRTLLEISSKFILVSEEDILNGKKVFRDGRIAIIGSHTKNILCCEDLEQLSNG